MGKCVSIVILNILYQLLLIDMPNQYNVRIVLCSFRDSILNQSHLVVCNRWLRLHQRRSVWHEPLVNVSRSCDLMAGFCANFHTPIRTNFTIIRSPTPDQQPRSHRSANAYQVPSSSLT